LINKNIAKIENLYKKTNKNTIEKDIIYEIYNNNRLKSKSLQKLIEICAPVLNNSSNIIKKLMKDNNEEILEVLFKSQLKFFDNFVIIDFLNYYKNKTSISNTELYAIINNEKYKISTDVKKYYLDLDFNLDLDLDLDFDSDFDFDFINVKKKFNSSYYLFNACENGNKAEIKFLIEHGANINIKSVESKHR